MRSGGEREHCGCGCPTWYRLLQLTVAWSASRRLDFYDLRRLRCPSRNLAGRQDVACKKTPAAAVDMTPSNRRFLVMALLFVTVVINYLDRSNLSSRRPASRASSAEFRCSPARCSRHLAGLTRRYRSGRLACRSRASTDALPAHHLLLVDRNALSRALHRPRHADHPAHDCRVIRGTQLPQRTVACRMPRRDPAG